MVLSKSFSVLRSAVTPRVLPPTIDLVRVNSRLTVFGLLGGTIGAGAIGIAFGVLLAFLPAGLVLYQVANGGLGLLQQWYMLKKYSDAPAG